MDGELNRKMQEKLILDLHAHTFLVEYIRVAEVLIVGYEHVVMNCGSARNRLVGVTCKSVRIDLLSDRFNFKKNILDRISSMSRALLIPKYQDYQTQHVLIIGTSQSRQHDKSEPVSYYLTD
nr:hypothetical protein [Tanacetum cinerariifolium]